MDNARYIRMEAKRKALEAIVNKPEPAPQVPKPEQKPSKPGASRGPNHATHSTSRKQGLAFGPDIKKTLDTSMIKSVTLKRNHDTRTGIARGPRKAAGVH
jgi:hypothetical protein